MQLKLLGLILLSVCSSAFAQLLLKRGMSMPAMEASVVGGSFLDVLTGIPTNPWVLGGLSLYFAGALVWLLVLAKVDVSYAYPFVGLGFILTMVLGRMVFGELVTVPRLFGTLLVALGVVLIART